MQRNFSGILKPAPVKSTWQNLKKSENAARSDSTGFAMINAVRIFSSHWQTLSLHWQTYRNTIPYVRAIDPPICSIDILDYRCSHWRLRNSLSWEISPWFRFDDPGNVPHSIVARIQHRRQKWTRNMLRRLQPPS